VFLRWPRSGWRVFVQPDVRQRFYGPGTSPFLPAQMPFC